MQSSSGEEGIPFVPLIPDEDEDDPEILRQFYGEITPGDPVIQRVERVLEQDNPADGLAQRFDNLDDDLSILNPKLRDWRIMAPDDPKGSVIQARVQDGVKKKIDHLISKTHGELWASPSDVVREAVYFYIRAVMDDLGTRDPTLLSLIAEAELSGRATFHAKRRSRLEKAVEDTRDYLTELLNLDDREEAERFLAELAHRIRAIQIMAWRRHWLLALNNLPILKVTARLLVRSGKSIPQEFYPAAELTLGGTSPTPTKIHIGETGVTAPGTAATE